MIRALGMIGGLAIGMLLFSGCGNDGEPQPAASAPASADAATYSQSTPAWDAVAPQPTPTPGDRFAVIRDNPAKAARQTPLSTFSIDVDTAFVYQNTNVPHGASNVAAARCCEDRRNDQLFRLQLSATDRQASSGCARRSGRLSLANATPPGEDWCAGKANQATPGVESCVLARRLGLDAGAQQTCRC